MKYIIVDQKYILLYYRDRAKAPDASSESVKLNIYLVEHSDWLKRNNPADITHPRLILCHLQHPRKCCVFWCPKQCDKSCGQKHRSKIQSEITIIE